MGRVMAFIDGENLLARFEAMKKDGLMQRDISAPGDRLNPITYEPGKFVWSPHTVSNLYTGDVLERVTYYTTMTGADDALEELNAAIGRCQTREIPYFSSGQHQLAFYRKCSRNKFEKQKRNQWISAFASMLWST